MSLGNDKAAKYATQNRHLYLFSTQFLNLPLSLTDIINDQANAPLSEKYKWIQKGSNNYQMYYTLSQMDFL